MRVLRVRNVHDALPQALQLLEREGVQRNSRNGPVLIGPSVTTVYEKPCERVLFWPTRDANPFFHLYECLWMIKGRGDVAGPAHFAKNIANYSDDGKTLHGAYGPRWRGWFVLEHGGHGLHNQLAVIADRLTRDPDDRRCVLQMWDPDADLNSTSKDVPCNVTATLQRGLRGELNLTVFCRSNDIVWGAYGANAVHFSFLLEYMALWIGCPVGTYTQVSVNWHGYLSTLEQVADIRPDAAGYTYNPYRGSVCFAPLSGSIRELDDEIDLLLAHADNPTCDPRPSGPTSQFGKVAYAMFTAHHAWSTLEGEARYIESLNILHRLNHYNDWIIAGREWILRRYDKWQNKQALEHP